MMTTNTDKQCTRQALAPYLLALLQVIQHPLQLLLRPSSLRCCCCSLRLQCCQLLASLLLLALLLCVLLLNGLQLASGLYQGSLQLRRIYAADAKGSKRPEPGSLRRVFNCIDGC
jgi:hypothetical protein